jgi:hypothetical protein
MGNLLSLDVSIHQRRTDTKKPRSGFDIHWHFEALDLPLINWLHDGGTFFDDIHAKNSSET